MPLLCRCQQVAEVGSDAWDYQTFIHPEDEDEEPEQLLVLQEIIDHYTGVAGQEIAEEDGEPEPEMSISEAYQGFNTYKVLNTQAQQLDCALIS